MIFSSDSDWNQGTGNWKNCLNCNPPPDSTGTTPRFWRMDMTALGNGTGCDFTHSYIPCSDLICAGNGDGLDFGHGGGTPTDNWNACTPVSVFPVVYSLPLQAAWELPGVRLDWETAQEKNALAFEILRSESPTGAFEKLASLPAAGNSDEARTYTWYDPQPLRGSNFYRLRQTDFNGSTHLSNIAEVQPLAETADGLTVLANGDGHLFIQKEAQPIDLRIFDLSGRQLIAQRFEGTQFYLDHGNWSQGVYLYQAKIAGKIVSGKFLVGSNR